MPVVQELLQSLRSQGSLSSASVLCATLHCHYQSSLLTFVSFPYPFAMPIPPLSFPSAAILQTHSARIPFASPLNYPHLSSPLVPYPSTISFDPSQTSLQPSLPCHPSTNTPIPSPLPSNLHLHPFPRFPRKPISSRASHSKHPHLIPRPSSHIP
jgi:hypothetical protein